MLLQCSEEENLFAVVDTIKNFLIWTSTSTFHRTFDTIQTVPLELVKYLRFLKVLFTLEKSKQHIQKHTQ